MRKKKLFNLLLALVITMFLLMGGTLVAEEFYETVGDVDFGGETVYFHFSHDVFSGIHGPPHLPERVEAAEEKFNVNIEPYVVPIEDLYESRQNRLMSGDSAYDVWMLNGYNVWPSIIDDKLLPISDYVPQSYFDNMPHIPRVTHEFAAIGDTKYTFSNIVDLENHWLIAFNKDIFDRAGLPYPSEYYQQGEWNWDTFEELIIELTQDTNNDGEINQWGLGGTNFYWWVMANDGSLTREAEDGRRVFAMNEENAINALEKLQQWHNEYGAVGGLLDDGNAAMGEFPTFALQLESPIENLGLVPFPKGPNAESTRIPADGVNFFALPANSEKPEAMVALVSYLLPNNLYGGSNRRLINRAPDRDSARILQELAGDRWDGSQVIASVIQGVGNDTVGVAFWEEVMPGNISAQAAMDSIAPGAQAILDELFLND